MPSEGAFGKTATGEFGDEGETLGSRFQGLQLVQRVL